MARSSSMDVGRLFWSRADCIVTSCDGVERVVPEPNLASRTTTSQILASYVLAFMASADNGICNQLSASTTASPRSRSICRSLRCRARARCMNWITSAGPPWTRCVLTASLTMSDGQVAPLCPEVVVVVLVVVLVRAHPTGIQVVATTPGT